MSSPRSSSPSQSTSPIRAPSTIPSSPPAPPVTTPTRKTGLRRSTGMYNIPPLRVAGAPPKKLYTVGKYQVDSLAVYERLLILEAAGWDEWKAFGPKAVEEKEEKEEKKTVKDMTQLELLYRIMPELLLGVECDVVRCRLWA